MKKYINGCYEDMSEAEIEELEKTMYCPSDTNSDNNITQRISKLEQQSKALAEQSQNNADEITNLQEAICEVYESII